MTREDFPAEMHHDEMREPAAEWLTLAETVHRLGKSQSTVERLVAGKQLASKTEPRPGRKPERLYRAADVERLKEEFDARISSRAVALLAPENGAQRLELALPEAAMGGMAEAVRELASALAYQADWAEENRGRVAVLDKLWLTIDEAAEYSGLGRADLKRLFDASVARGDGKPLIVRRSGRRPMILRKSLEAFEG